MYKNNFATITFLILTAAFTATNSMEIVPSKKFKAKFEKTDNIIHNHGKTERNIELPINPRPIIPVKLYIDYNDNKAHYIGINHYKLINDTGIKSSIQDQQKMPVISVIVMDSDRNYWTDHDIPNAIIEYEWKNNLTEEEQRQQYYQLRTKVFPDTIPADILYEHKTNDIINLTVHGYPVIATCSDHPHINLSFKEHFTKHIDSFKKEAFYFLNLGSNDNVGKQLQEVGLIAKSKGNHGPNRFISIDKLLLEDKNIPNMLQHLKQREIGHRTSKISSHAEKFPVITRDAFLPQQNDNIDDEDNQQECIIS